jgi:hypothetical protein
MAIDNKYGKVTFEHGSIGDDEPVFVLRGRDQLAMLAIAQYGHLCQAANTTDDHLGAIQEALDQFAEWTQEHIEELRKPSSAEYMERIGRPKDQIHAGFDYIQSRYGGDATPKSED